MDEKTLSVNIVSTSEKLQQDFNRAIGFLKSFATSFNKILGNIGKVSGTSNTTTASTSEVIKKESDEMLNSAENTANEIKKNNKKIEDSYTELRIVGIYAFRSLSRTFNNIISSMSSAGAQLYELNSRFSIIMEDMTSQAEEFADKLGEAYGLNEATIKENMLRLYTLGQNAGLANEKALELTKTMSRLGVEVASVWDVPIEQATDNLISALQGLPRAMKKYGSYVGTTEIKEFFNQYRESQGLEPLTRELTRQEKVLGVYLKSLSDLGYAFGDFERTVTSTANQTRIMQETLATIRQTGGQLINTVLSPLLQFGNQILKTISKFTKGLTKLPESIQRILGTLMLLILITPSVVGSMTLFIYYSTKMKESLKSLSVHLGTSSKALLNFGKTALYIVGVISSLLGIIIGFYSILDSFDLLSDKTDNSSNSLNNMNNSAKDLKRTLSSFDDVNIFKEQDSSDELSLGDIDMDEFLSSIGLASEDLTELNDLFESTTNAAKGLSIAITAIGIGSFVVSIIKVYKALKNWFSGLSLVDKMLGTVKLSIGSVIAIVANLAALITNIVGLFINWGDMNTAQRVVSVITAIASAAFLLASALAAIKGNYPMAIALGVAGTAAGALGSIVAFSSKDEEDKTVVANNVGSNSRTIASSYNANDTTSNIGTSISNAVMAGMAGMSNDKPINVNVNVNVDEEYIYKAYNKVAKQNGVI